MRLNAGAVIAADRRAHNSDSTPRVERCDTGGNVETWWGSYGGDDGEFIGPGGVAVGAAGNVHAAEGGNDRIQKFDPNGAFLLAVGRRGSGDGEFDAPKGVAVDGLGNVYVADANGDRIQTCSPA